MSTEVQDVLIRVREDGSRVVTRNFDNMAQAGDRAASTLSTLKGIVATVVTGVAIRQLLRYADAWANATGLIAIATKTQEEAVDVTKKLFDAAQRTRSAFGDVVNVYAAAARASAQLGASQEDTIKFTEGLGKALAVQHVSAEQAQGSLLQLGQLLASGKVHAQEFNSVLLGTPVILQTVARGLGDATGNVSLLRNKMLAGTLTSKEFFKGFLDGLPRLDQDFKKSAFTFGQGFTIISNSLQKWIGEMNEALGVSAAFGRAARFIANNMENIAHAIGDAAKAAFVAATAFGAFKLAVEGSKLADRVSEFVAYRIALAQGTVVQLGSAEAERQRAVALYSSALAAQSATASQVAADVAIARSTAIATEARLADVAATQAALAVARQDALAKLASSNAQIASAKSAQELAKANLSVAGAVQLLEKATLQEMAAEQARIVVLRELTVLGAQQARVTTEQAAAATANAAAQGTLSASQAAAATANAAAAANSARATQSLNTATAAAAGTTTLLGQAFNAVKNAASAAFGIVSKFFALINLNPFTVLLTTLVAVIGFVTIFGDRINAGIDNLTTLKDVFVAFGLTVLDALRPLADAIKGLFSGLYDIVAGVFSSIGEIIGPAITSYLSSFQGFFDGVGHGFAGVVKGIARVVDAIAGLLTGLSIAVLRAFTGLPTLIIGGFKKMFNGLSSLIEDQVNVIIDGINFVRKSVGASLIESVKLTKLDVDENLWKNYGKGIASSIEDGFAQQDGFAEKFVDKVFDRAKNRAQDRALAGDVKVTAHAREIGGAGGAPAVPDEKEIKRVTSALRNLLNTIDPISGALLEMEKATQTLNDAERLGLITTEQHSAYLVRLKEHYKDILDPLGALNRELDQQTKLLGLNVRQREVESQVLEATKKLLSDGVILTTAETAALRDKFTALQALNEATAAQDQLLADSVDKRRDFLTQTQAIVTLLKDPGSGFGQGDAASAATGIIASMGLDPTGFKTATDAIVNQSQTMYQQIAVLRDQHLISEQEAAALEAQVWANSQAQRLQGAQNFLGQLAQLQNSKSKTAARVGKAAAIAQAVIETYKGANSAYSAMAGIPYIGPALGIAAAAAAVAAGMANVQAIRAQPIGGYMKGGYTGNGPTDAVAGVVHGKEHVFDATSTRRLGVGNLEALRRGDATISRGNEGGGWGVNVEIKNYGTSKQFEVQQLSRDEVRIIARDEAKQQVVRETPKVFAAEMANPNSKTSKAVSHNTTAQRNR